MAKTVTKSAQAVLEDAKTYYEYLMKKTKTMEKDYNKLREKMEDEKVEQKKRREAQNLLSLIKANHFKMDALETILYK